MADTTFIVRYATEGDGPTLAIKDLIDIEGSVTTAGSAIVAARALPAERDATCLAGARQAGARIVGKTNLVELALGVSGINPHYGTPVNPLDPMRIPGGSSSGSAVAVGAYDADLSYGSDTGGSIRLPAACCGIVGLKTTHGRVSLDGVWPLAPSLDSVGPMARDVAGVIEGMRLLEPGFAPSSQSSFRVGRVRLPATTSINDDIDQALSLAGVHVEEVEIPEWFEVWQAALNVIEYEAAQVNADLLDRLPEIDPSVAARLRRGASLSQDEIAASRELGTSWRERTTELLANLDALITPTLPDIPPLVSEATGFRVPHLSPINLAGLPAIALPVGQAKPIPASMHVVGASMGEEMLVSFAALIEQARNAGS